MMRWFGGGMGIGAWFVMGVFWLLLVALIVWLVVQLVRPRHDEHGRPVGAPGQPWHGPVGGVVPGYPESPFEILDRRLAAGEIDLPTYHQLRAALVESRGGMA